LKKHSKNFDQDHSGSLSKDEFLKLLKDADSHVKALPSTAQVANQQGVYLGKALSLKANGLKSEPFKYLHLGSFAYIGENNAVGEVPGMLKGGGFAVWWIWRGIYLWKQTSLRNMVLISFDWIKVLIFGRDYSKF